MSQRRLRTVRILESASDTDLVASLANHDEEALRELSHRHAAALSVLAYAIVRQPTQARRAVDDIFATVWAAPGHVGVVGTSVRAQFARMVHERCCAMALHPSAMRDEETARERIAVALIAFGDHTCREAAERVGTDATTVGERLRGFVLDPDHFAPFCNSDRSVVTLRDS